MPSRSIGAESLIICETFSSSVMRERRSSTRFSVEASGFGYSGFSCEKHGEQTVSANSTVAHCVVAGISSNIQQYLSFYQLQCIWSLASTLVSSNSIP